ncbi:IS3 family transposase [Paenibacillus durus]|uniref:IS3 family transposase n=1 Tax=Paenibacillus durus TaxID=44251 RepID=UPI00398677BD
MERQEVRIHARSSTSQRRGQDMEDYIRFYNNERLQAKLNGPSPMEFRTKAA